MSVTIRSESSDWWRIETDWGPIEGSSAFMRILAGALEAGVDEFSRRMAVLHHPAHFPVELLVVDRLTDELCSIALDIRERVGP